MKDDMSEAERATLRVSLRASLWEAERGLADAERAEQIVRREVESARARLAALRAEAEGQEPLPLFGGDLGAA